MKRQIWNKLCRWLNLNWKGIWDNDFAGLWKGWNIHEFYVSCIFYFSFVFQHNKLAQTKSSISKKLFYWIIMKFVLRLNQLLKLVRFLYRQFKFKRISCKKEQFWSHWIVFSSYFQQSGIIIWFCLFRTIKQRRL